MCRFKLLPLLHLTLLIRFNTSYVSVQGLYPVLKSFFLSSFNTSYVSVQVIKNEDWEYKIEFQYILCVGSSCIKAIIDIAVD